MLSSLSTNKVAYRNIILQLSVVYGKESTESTTSCQYMENNTHLLPQKGEVEYIIVFQMSRKQCILLPEGKHVIEGVYSSTVDLSS